jgi:hypothetical protein
MQHGLHKIVFSLLFFYYVHLDIVKERLILRPCLEQAGF